MKLRYLLPFLVPFYLGHGQFKAETNLHSVDVKSSYFDVSARDTFGLKNVYDAGGKNLKGKARLKISNQIAYFSRPGLENFGTGVDFKIPFVDLKDFNSAKTFFFLDIFFLRSSI